MKNRSTALALSTVALVSATFWGCGQIDSPAQPTPDMGGDATAAPLRRQTTPHAVFGTTPPMGPDGMIAGSSPLTVQFNLCQSRPINEDDRLRYSFDFDGNGEVDFYGHCRAEYTYENPNSPVACVSARLCVSDRRPAGEVCRTIDVCTEGAAAEPQPEPAATPTPTPEPEGE
jgi:hypothetical protein